ncbi:GerAB/ArcD/ProY family transporter [Alkalihalobacillus deserti]|uniref:GerAB/ArcD/ProY family transporter n=1 Tax=Alkalihalobacillus deserti TaxID=2879466 RepID=UPI001D1534A7|nr:endospore germination permease [Alkalihalobacillus deserti]
MDEKVRISPLQLCILTILYTAGTTILAMPSTMAAKTNQDAWLSALIGTLACIIIAFFFWVCGRAMGRETYIQYLQRVYGKLIGKIIGFSYVLFSFIGVSSLLFYFSNFTKTQILINTPIEILNLMLAVLIMVVIRAGFEVLARTGELLFPWFMILFLALVILLLPELKLERMSPLFETGFKDHLSAILDFTAITGLTLIVFLMFLPRNINTPENSKWNFITGALIGSLIVSIIILLCILVLGASATARQMFPSYVLAKTVSVFEIVERIEAIMAGMWIISIFFKASIYFYACVVGLAQLLEVRNYRFLVIPMGILAVIFSTVVYPNVAYMIHWDSTYFPPYAIIMGIFIPLLTLIIDKMKKRSKLSYLIKEVQ